jgi:hypothetical protein
MTYVYEKIAAICAIGHFANAAPMKFAAFFEPTLAMLEKLFFIKLGTNPNMPIYDQK